MQATASAKPVPAALVDRLQQELAEITAIYDRLYHDRALELVLLEGSDPVWSAPHVTEGPMTLRPHHLGANFLGRIARPGPHPGAQPVTVVLSVPRSPTPGEIQHAEVPWKPQRGLKLVFGLAPMLYEQIRYTAEMIRKRRAARRHDRTSLIFGQGAAMLPNSHRAPSPARPAILIGFHWLEVGGAEKLAFDCVTWALEAGLRVFVVASIPSVQRLADRLPDHPDVTFIRLDRYLPHHLWPRYVARLVQDENISLVHIHHCQPLYESLPQLRVTAPWVRVIDSTHIIEYANGGYPRISGVWSNYIDTHHVISGVLADYFRDTFHLLDKVRLGRMLTRSADAVTLPPPNMTTGKKSLHVTFVGRLYYQKRPIVMVRTLRALSRWARRNGVELRGTVVGEGPFEGAVARLLQRYGLAESVTTQPAGADVPALLRESDILLLPSNNEGLALVCYEAIEQGCIPISTDVGAQAEIVPDDLRVGLPPAVSVRETVRAVDRLWRDPDFLAQQQAALEAAWTRLTADPTAKEVLMPAYLTAAGQDATAATGT